MAEWRSTSHGDNRHKCARPESAERVVFVKLFRIMRSKCLFLLVVSSLLLFTTPGLARGGHGTHGSKSHSNQTKASSSNGPHRSNYSSVAQRDKHGRIARSESAHRKFMRMTGYPHGRPGYVVDHIVPLKRGGKDDTTNMQWQTIADAKAKDGTE